MDKTVMEKDVDTADVIHDEKEHHTAVPTSAFATLTRAQCVKKFWRLYITGLGVSLAGMYVMRILPTIIPSLMTS